MAKKTRRNAVAKRSVAASSRRATRRRWAASSAWPTAWSCAAEKRRDPYVDIPSRTLSNVHYSPRKRILEMGNAHQPPAAVRPVAGQGLHADDAGRQRLQEADRRRARRPASAVCSTCSSTRSKARRKTPSTTRANATRSSKTSRCCSTSLREELHLYADKRGEMVGNITIIDSGDEIDCSRMGSGGYAIPSIVEPEVIQFDPKKCDAKFVLHVEKDTVWQRFNEDQFWEKHNCILTHGGGQPPRGVRRMLLSPAQRAEAADLLPAR